MREKIIAALSKVFDPEIPMDIYSLGLIYEVRVNAAGEAYIKMTLTAPNCPVAGSLPAEVERKARAVRTRLQNSRMGEIFQTGLHEFISEFIADNNQLGAAVAEQYLM